MMGRRVHYLPPDDLIALFLFLRLGLDVCVLGYCIMGVFFLSSLDKIMVFGLVFLFFYLFVQ